MLKIAYHPIYAHPLPEGHRFPMLKYELIPQQLLHHGLITSSNLFEPGNAKEDVILLTHDQVYWEDLRDLKLSHKAIRRIGFPLTKQLVERELIITQGTIDAALFAKEYGAAFNVAGGTHHAGSHWGEGFCLLNDQAIAANYLLKENLAKRILIIDLDVHQGNGTAQIFKDNKEVFTFSMHGQKNFPFHKETSDLDLGLPDGMNDHQYLNLLKEHLNSTFKHFEPDFVFYLAGVDVLATDKLGKLALTKDACRQRDELVFTKCRESNIPVQVSMGGGYSPRISDIVDAHCNTFQAALQLFF